jgi:hypothetical protein
VFGRVSGQITGFLFVLLVNIPLVVRKIRMPLIFELRYNSAAVKVKKHPPNLLVQQIRFVGGPPKYILYQNTLLKITIFHNCMSKNSFTLVVKGYQ